MLRISFFAAASYAQGTYFRWHNLAIGLQQLGHQVTVYAIGPEHGGRSHLESRDGVCYSITPLPPRLLRFLHPWLDPITLLRVLRRPSESSDIYHVFQPFPHSCLPGLFHRSHRQNLFFDWDDLWSGGLFPVLKTFPWPATWPNRAIQLLEQRMPYLAGAVTTCSNFLSQRAQVNGATNTQVIHNGYWPTHSFPTRIEARTALKLNPDAFYFGFMGRTVGELEWCLDALAKPFPNGQQRRLALCGMHPSIIDALPQETRASIDYLGQLTPAQTRTFASALDCGLLPLDDTPFNQSRFPIKFAEYLAAGAHVIASAVGEFAELARSLPGVTLCGKTRESWKRMLVDTDWSGICIPFSTEPNSKLAQMLGWPALALQLQDFYISQLRS